MKCKTCTATLERRATGRPPTYCSPGCRKMAELAIRRATRRLEKLENEASESRIRQAMMHGYPLEAEQARADVIANEIQALETRLRELLDEEDHAGGAAADQPKVQVG